MSEGTSKFGIQIVGDSSSADAAAAKTAKSLDTVSAKAQQTSKDMAAASTSAQRMGDSSAESFKKVEQAATKAGREIVDAGTAAARGDWEGAARSAGQFGESVGVARISLVGFAATAALVAGTVVTLYRAYEGGVAEVDNMNRAMSLSGNYAGQTRSSMRELALEMSGFNSTVKESKETVTALAASGLIASQSFDSVSRLVGEYASATKRSVDEVRPEVIRLFQDSAKGAEDLNRSMHFLTAAELEQIRTLQESGREGEAQLLLSERLRESVARHETQLGLIDRALKTVKGSWASFWDAALAVGRPQTLGEQLEQARKGVEGLNMRRADHRALAVQGQGTVSQLEARVENENDQAWVNSFKAQLEKNKTAWNDLAKNYRSNAERAAEEMKKAKSLAVNSGMSLDDPSVKKVLAEIQDKYKEKAPKAAKTTDYERLTDRLKEYATQLDVAADKGDKLTQGDRLAIDVQRELTSAQQATLKPLLDQIKAREAAAEAAKKQAAADASLLQIQSLEQSFSRDNSSRRLQMQVMPALDRQQLLDQIAVEEKARTTRDQLARQFQRNEIDANQYANAIGKLNEVIDRQKDSISDLRAQQEGLNSTWEYGASRALQSYADQAANVAAQTEAVFQRAFGGMEDAMVDFVRTGKLDFRGLADSIIADLVRMQIRASITGQNSLLGTLFAKGAASFFGGGSSAAVDGAAFQSAADQMAADGLGNMISTGGFHTGGIVGAEPTFTRSVDAGIFDGAPRYHTGGIVGDEVPAILKRGEGVFTEGQMAAMGGGGGTSVVIDMPVTIDARGAEAGVEERMNQSLVQLEARIYKNVPNVVRSAQIKNRTTPNV